MHLPERYAQGVRPQTVQIGGSLAVRASPPNFTAETNAYLGFWQIKLLHNLALLVLAKRMCRDFCWEEMHL